MNIQIHFQDRAKVWGLAYLACSAADTPLKSLHKTLTPPPLQEKNIDKGQCCESCFLFPCCFVGVFFTGNVKVSL